MAGTAAQQRSSRQNHCEIPLHNRHGIASQREVSAKYFKYRSNRNTQWKLICQLYVLLCFILIVVTNFLTEAAYGRTGLYLCLDSGISFCGVGEGLGQGGGKIRDNSWSHSVVKDQEAESTAEP